MRPIDVIRTKMDPDLLKYNQTMICEIVNGKALRQVKGVGMCAWVRPLDKYSQKKPWDKSKKDEIASFPVRIINAPFTAGWEVHTHLKYFVLVINSGLDSPSFSSGMLVPTSSVLDKESMFSDKVTERRKDYIVTTK